MPHINVPSCTSDALHLTTPNRCAMYSPYSLTYGDDVLLFGRACSYVTIKADDSVALLLYVCSMAGRCSQCCLNVASVSFATSIRVLLMEICCSSCRFHHFKFPGDVGRHNPDLTAYGIQ